MITLLKRLFIENWQRKLISFILAMVVWILINHSMTAQKTVYNIPVKIENVPKGKTVEGLHPDGFLQRKISLTLSGNKHALDEMVGNDFMVVIDASGKKDEWVSTITRRNLVNLNPINDVVSQISKVSEHDFLVKLNNVVTEKIPVLVTQPIGEPPKGYQFLETWPYHFTVTVTGPEDRIRQLKSTGVKLTFNLGEIAEKDLDEISKKQNSEEISYFVPESWKKVNIPCLSNTPFTIDDPKIKNLRVELIKSNLIPLKNPIPISIFFPLKYTNTLNPDTLSIKSGGIVENRNGIKIINAPLFAYGVSRTFVDFIKDMIQVNIIAAPKSERDNLLWNVEFIYPHDLEDRYLAKTISEMKEKENDPASQQIMEQHIRNRFRSYMNKFRLYTQKNQKLSLQIETKNGFITITQKKNHN